MPLPALVAGLLAVLAALAVWLALFNRLVNFGAHGPVKLFVTGLSLVLALGAGVLWPGFASAPLSHAVPMVVIAFMALGELHRAWMRKRAHACSLAATPSGRERPISTTALVVRRAIVTATGVGRLRVVHLSDLHVGPHLPFEYFRSALARSMAERPDLILVTGDFISHKKHLPLLRRLLVGSLQARYGVYAVLGNHDYWSDPAGVTGVLDQAGIRRVVGAPIPIDLGAQGQVELWGTEAPWGPKLNHSPPASHTPRLVLSHTPDNVYRLARTGATAVFSGHTHGGQFRLPGLGGLIVPSCYGRRFDRGHYRVGNTHLFVSAGVGIDSIPLRLFCSPEFTVVDFVSPASIEVT
jgi:predicted MPP superfamily phosphohydrolase